MALRRNEKKENANGGVGSMIEWIQIRVHWNRFVSFLYCVFVCVYFCYCCFTCFIPEGIHFVNGVYINKIHTYIHTHLLCVQTHTCVLCLSLFVRLFACMCGLQCRCYLFSVFAFTRLPKSKLYKCNCISYLRWRMKRHENLWLSNRLASQKYSIPINCIAHM